MAFLKMPKRNQAIFWPKEEAQAQTGPAQTHAGQATRPTRPNRLATRNPTLPTSAEPDTWQRAVGPPPARWRQPASAGFDLHQTRPTRACFTRAHQKASVQLTRASCDWDSSGFDQNQPKKPPITHWHVAVRYLSLGNCIFTPLTLLNCILALFPTL